jgi:hypothetical protein
VVRAILLPVLGLLIGTMAAAAAEQGQPGVRDDVLAAVENELERLSMQAEAETGPVHPRPSSEIAFLILTGLAAQGAPIQAPAPEDLRQLGIAPADAARVQVFTVAADARVVIRTSAIQDKAGSWTSRSATLYRRRSDKWMARGSGSTALDDVSVSAVDGGAEGGTADASRATVQRNSNASPPDPSSTSTPSSPRRWTPACCGGARKRASSPKR